MKIKARVIFENTPIYYDVPVGLGDKTFKWLGMSVCQRFALSNPNGGLRRRDPIRRGVTDRALHQPYEVSLSNGAFPHPQALLSDFLHDGDEVTIKLISDQGISQTSGKPVPPTKWATLAFSSTGEGLEAGGAEDGGAGGEEDAGGDDNGVFSSADDENSPEGREVLAKAQFMRTIFQSQMPNIKKITHAVETHWRVISKGMPKLKPEDEEAMKADFVENWDLLVDIFERFAPDGKLGRSALHSILQEAEVFDEKTLSLLAPRIFRRACEATGTESSLSIPGLMVAFMICAQNLFNDTQTASVGSSGREQVGTPGQRLGSGQALAELFSRNFYALAERLECFCVLKV